MTLQVQGVGARFGGITALADLDVEVGPGEIVAVIGPNGSGKSTLFNCITGFVPLSGGEVHVDGRDITRAPADQRIRSGIARTFQTPRIDPEVTVLTSVLCGYLASVPSSLLASALAVPPVLRAEHRIERQARELLAEFGMSELAEVPIGQLSMGQVRMVDVLRAMAMEPSYLLLDEPAAGLSVAEQAMLTEGVRRIADRGVGVVLVEHNFRLIREIADRALVLNKGRLLVEGPPDRVADDPRVVDAYLGLDDDAARLAPQDLGAHDDHPVVLRCEGLDVSYGRARVCEQVSFSVRSGQIMALLGANGAGKSSLLSAIAGLRLESRRWRGAVRLLDTEISALPADRRPGAGLAFVPEGRRNVFPGMSVEENIELGLRSVAAASRGGVRERILDVFPALATLMASPAGLLSGGEQQMVAIAMAIATEPKALLLDEPTQGLAPAILDVLIEAFATLRDQDIAIVLAEQNHAFAASLADEFLVLAHGEVVVTGDNAALRQRDEIAAAYL